jgi:hypothetical protein
MERMVEPMYRRVMQQTNSSLHNTLVHRFYHTFHELPPTILTLK